MNQNEIVEAYANELLELHKQNLIMVDEEGNLHISKEKPQIAEYFDEYVFASDDSHLILERFLELAKSK